jgi:hypothetical protein
MKKYLVLFACALISAFLSSCESTTPPIATPKVLTDSTLFIVSEGNATKNNSELDAYSLKTNTLSSNIVNPLGDIANDIQLFGDRLYVLLENSNKVISINPDSVADRKTIQFPAGVTPYKMAKTSISEVWVTEFTGKQIEIMAPSILTGTIDVDTGQQDIGILNGKAFIVTNGNKLLVIDVTTKQILSNKYIGDSPAQVMIDSARSSVVILTYGFYGVSAGKILWVNPTTFSVTDSSTIAAADFINMMIPAGNKAFLTYGDRVGALDLVTHKITTAIASKSYYKGMYDGLTNQLILGDAKDFSSPGVVDIYDATSLQLKKSISSGISPGHFLIYRK